MKPIICNSGSVNAILAGRKTQTRRVIKRVSPRFAQYRYAEGNIYPYYFRRRDAVWDSFKTLDDLIKKYCPYGIPGDKLWVREAWNAQSIDGIWWRDFKGDLTDKVVFNWNLYYKSYGDECNKWLPSTRMPKDFSRITLEIKDVRVERVQDISIEDVVAEGIDSSRFYEHDPYDGDVTGWDVAWGIDLYGDLWDSINAKKGFGWDTNPWVWVLEFEKL